MNSTSLHVLPGGGGGGGSYSCFYAFVVVSERDAEIAQECDKYQDIGHQLREFGTQRDQLQHMLTTRQEKMAKLSLQHQSRMKVLQEQLAAEKE